MSKDTERERWVSKAVKAMGLMGDLEDKYTCAYRVYDAGLAARTECPTPVTLDEPMTEEFKEEWQNGIPLSSPEAKWAFVGWQAARAQQAVSGMSAAYSAGYFDGQKGLEFNPHSQQADAGAVPEGWRELVNCVRSLVRQRTLSDSDTVSVGLWKQEPDKPQFHSQFEFSVKDFTAAPTAPARVEARNFDTVYWHFEGSEQDNIETLHNDVQVVISAGTLKGLLNGAPARVEGGGVPKTARKLIGEVVGNDDAHDLISRLEDHLGIYEDVYEQIVEMIEPHVCRDGINPEGPLPASVVGSVEVLLEHYLAHPHNTEQGEWIKCSDRLPTEADADFNGEVWVFDPYEPFPITICETHEVSDPNITHWKPTGLKRPEPPTTEAEKAGGS